MVARKNRVSSGIRQLDQILGGGVFIGDNVVWYDDVGSLASMFCFSFIKASQAQKKSLIYVSFDRSLKNFLDQFPDLPKHSIFGKLMTPMGFEAKAEPYLIKIPAKNKSTLPLF